MNTYKLNLPLSANDIQKLNAGDVAILSGTIHTARDAAHKRFCESLDNGEKLAIDLSTATIFYCGPTPTRAGEIIGSCGPTTSARMDDYTPQMIKAGLRVMIGKGKRNDTVNQHIKDYNCVYFVSVGGAGALTKNAITKNTPVCYQDLGCEAVNELTVKDFAVVVGTDWLGNTILK